MVALARAHTNIALIKYWGKKDSTLKIPMNSSLSLTLDSFYTDTSFEIITDETPSQFYLNDRLQTAENSKRVFNYISVLQQRFGLAPSNFIIKSENHVPTSAGLASSSSAFAALAAAFSSANKLEVDRTELSRMARLGSGSATRSIFGGFVEWQKGSTDSDSVAIAIDEHPHFDLHLLAIEINFSKKGLSSTSGMQNVVETSPYYPTWVKEADIGINEMRMAIMQKDFTKLGTLAEKSALAMHALNLTATPPFTYFAPETIQAIRIVEQLRRDGIECYVTIDAGPNVKVLSQLRNVKEIIQRFKKSMRNVNIIEASFGPGVRILD